ncbi:A/G-specific adenine glycosylase [Mesorhizobium sp. BAC0120]|uniref:A/G-specific adenine glycosylase n=1 Tax=Mesorhizobium sp. BAC0120 TaxID=3090670 RepID=UPI00298CB715|nr:A/G-specific adenine glycosylase [Mesorhizobium sp. BAC0120]MDW6020932.1 A/G-specific adenine glycosylase [Mesorhizobium sp. BAC0120]
MSLRQQSRKTIAGEQSPVAAKLLTWYDRHHRELPWRTGPAALARGERPDPYRVWLSEIMLQQTTVEAVKPYFRVFVERWPDIAALAAADADEIMKAWAGLGYYSRARNLKKCAQIVVSEHSARFPDTIEDLSKLPGVGPYTAAAIAAIAFDRPAAVVDGNVERVISRLDAVETPLPAAKPLIRAAVENLTPSERPGDFAQAMMDLGATICTPKRPSCMICPLNDDCMALSQSDPERFPAREAKAARPQRVGAAFVAVRNDGAVLLRKRVENGLLGGMAEVPGTDWTARRDGQTDAAAAPFLAEWRFSGRIQHVFTHFALDLAVFRADVGDYKAPADYWWAPLDAIHNEALPTVMKKAIEAAIPGITKRRKF